MVLALYKNWPKKGTKVPKIAIRGGIEKKFLARPYAKPHSTPKASL